MITSRDREMEGRRVRDGGEKGLREKRRGRGRGRKNKSSKGVKNATRLLQQCSIQSRLSQVNTSSG